MKLFFVVLILIPWIEGMKHPLIKGFKDMFPVPVPIQKGRDYGEPLFLTPLIQAGEIEQAKDLSRVGHLNGTDVISYSGFLTVRPEFDSNLFFWFFPAYINPAQAPVVLWLQGGPGGSSMYGLFAENGPFYVDANQNLRPRNYTWANEFNLIYIDNPVGTGFSFTNSTDGYATTETAVGNDLYIALQQFFTLFAELRPNDFFVTGESYAGKYVPAIAYTIHNENPNAVEKINLKGIAIGDGLVDPTNNMRYGDFLYTIGLIDEIQLQHFLEQEALMEQLINDGQNLQAYEVISLLLASTLSYFHRVSGFWYYYNYLESTGPTDDGYYSEYLANEDVRKAIHVGDLLYHSGIEVELFLLEDFMNSTKPWVETLLDNDYLVLIYNGQLDIIIPYVSTRRFVNSMDWKYRGEFNATEQITWKVTPEDDEIAGYVKSTHNFYQILVRNSGHILPYDQPRVGYDMITRFVFGIPYS